MSGFLDRLPASVRHFIFAVTSVAALAGLTYAEANYTTWNLPEVAVGVIAAVIPVAIAYLTPLTQQYGVGSDGGV